MKRRVFLLVLVVLLSALLSACVVDQNEASKFCKLWDDFGYTHGQCVSYITSASGIAGYCQENWEMPLRHNRVWYYFENQGDCVSTINSWDLLARP
jgi:hypothetical protein